MARRVHQARVPRWGGATTATRCGLAGKGVGDPNVVEPTTPMSVVAPRSSATFCSGGRGVGSTARKSVWAQSAESPSSQRRRCRRPRCARWPTQRHIAGAPHWNGRLLGKRGGGSCWALSSSLARCPWAGTRLRRHSRAAASTTRNNGEHTTVQWPGPQRGASFGGGGERGLLLCSAAVESCSGASGKPLGQSIHRP